MTEDYNFIRSFKINGKDTKHLFQIAQINIPFLSKDNEYFTVGNTNGKHFRDSRLGDYSISIDGFIIKDNSKMTVSNTKDELVKLVNSKEPQMLEFDILPDRYFMGVYSGVHEYDGTNVDYTPLTLVFDVPEAFARSKYIDTFSNMDINSTNKFIDSEFNNINKYFKTFVSLTGTKFNESNVAQVDFTNGYPYNQPTGSGGLLYAQYTPNTKQRINNLTTTDKIGFMGSFNVIQLEEGISPETIIATLHLDQYSSSPERLIKSSEVNIKAKDITVGSWNSVSDIVPVVTGAEIINLAIGFHTLSKFNFSELAFFVNPPAPLVYTPTRYNKRDFLEVYNDGTHDTPIQATFTMTSENSLVGLLNVTNRSVLQFGNPEDVDGISKVKNETVVKLPFRGNTTGFDYTNDKFISAYPRMFNNNSLINLQNGSWDTTSQYESISPKYTLSPNNIWNGPSGVTNIPSPSSNDRTQAFKCLTRFYFNSHGNIKSRGRFEISVMGDSNTEPFMNLSVRDSSVSKQEMIVEGFYKGKLVWTQNINTSKNKTNFWEVTLERRASHVWFRIGEIRTLTGDTVSKHWGVFTFKYMLEEPDDTIVSRLGFWISRFGTSSNVKQMELSHSDFIWLNSPYWSNVNNIFSQNDEVLIDVDRRSIYVNGIENLELNTLGNDWDGFVLPIGQTHLQPIVSDFSNKPEVIVNIQKRYL